MTTSTMTIMKESGCTDGRSISRSHQLDHCSPVRDRYPQQDHYSSRDGYPSNKRQRRDDDSEYPRQRDAPVHVMQHRNIAKLRSTAGSRISRSSTSTHQSRTSMYNPNDPNDKKSRSRANLEILEIRSCPPPCMDDISASTCCRFPKEAFTVGAIIKAPIHEEDFKWTARPQPQSMETSELSGEQGRYSHSGVSTEWTSQKKGRHITFSNWNDPIYTEIRFMIVVALFHDHYLAIPLYTHGGTGLTRKENKWEYASIQDHRGPKSLHEAQILLHTEYLKSDFSRKYTLPVAPQGYLRQDSKVTLVELFRAYMSGGRPA